MSDFASQHAGASIDYLAEHRKKKQEEGELSPVDSSEIPINENVSQWILSYSKKVDPENLDTEQKGRQMTDSSSDKYIDQRFKNVEEKLDHRVEMVSIKIDALSDKISDNTEWMKQMVSDHADSMKQMVNTISADVKEIKSEGKLHE